MIKKISHLSTSLVCAGFLFGTTSVYAALSCDVCQSDVCGFSKQLADACIKECGTYPSIKSCKSAARRAFHESRRDQVHAERQAQKESAAQDEEANLGSLFGESDSSSQGDNQAPAENIDATDQNFDQPMSDQQDSNNQDQPMNEAPQGENSLVEPAISEPVASPAPNKAPTLHHSQEPEGKRMGEVCKTPQANKAAITRAIDLLKSIEICGDDAAQSAQSSDIPAPPPAPNFNQHAPGKAGGHINKRMLKDGRKNLRPAGQRQHRNNANQENGAPVPPPPPAPNFKQHAPGKAGGHINANMLEEGRKNLRPVGQRKHHNNAGQENGAPVPPPPPAPNFKQHAPGKAGGHNNANMLEGARSKLRKTTPNERPKFEVNQDPFAKQLQEQHKKLRPVAQRNREADQRHNQPQQEAREAFHNSESGDSGLDKFGKMLTSQVMNNVVGQGG